MNADWSWLKWGFRLLALYFLFIVVFVAGAAPVASVLPADATSEPGLVSPTPAESIEPTAAPAGAASEPGLVSPTLGLLIVALVNVLVICALVLTSRWHGWRLAATLALAYYGVVTFLPQMETWYFLSVTPELLLALFMMGVPTAAVVIPLAVWLLGRGRAVADGAPRAELARSVRRRTIWKLAVLLLAYVVLYFGAGYFIAWQNPELRAFYGEPGDPLPFWITVTGDPTLILFQVLRGLLWVLCALPIILGSRLSAWWTAILVGLFFSLPQNVFQILPNPLMPDASVRFSHMIETASSTFVFGVLVVWLLSPELARRRTQPAVPA